MTRATPEVFPRLVFAEGQTFPNPESDLAPDGNFPPFYVFDSEKQAHVSGPHATREAAEAAALAYEAQTAPESPGWADLTPETAEGLETAAKAPAGLTAERFTAPEFWAPGLVNGDWSGTDPAERKAAEAWAATLGGPVVSAEAAGFLWRHEAFAFWPFGVCAAVYSVLIQHKETEQ